MKPLSLLFLALFNSILGLSLLFPIMGPLGRELGLTEFQVGTLSTAYALTQLVSGPYWARRSDFIGRKPVILRGVLGFAFTFLAFGLVAKLGLSHVISGRPLFYSLLATRLLGGLYSSATLPTVQVYVADVTAREDRTRSMALIGAAFGLGIVFGPGIGAVLAPFGLLVPVFLSCSVAFLNALFIALKLPEPERHREPEPTLDWLPVANKVKSFLLVGFATTVASVSMEQTVVFYIQDRLQLSAADAARTAGISLMLYGLVAVGVQGGLVRRVSWPPLALLRVGVPIAAAGLVAFVFAKHELSLIFALLLQGCGQAFTMPGVTASVSLGVDDQEQSVAAGLNSSTQGLARVVGPVLGTRLYQIHAEYPYAFGAALLTLALAFLLVYRPPRPSLPTSDPALR
jgi:MFS family permease